jgi:large subunit ribosomal protein L6
MIDIPEGVNVRVENHTVIAKGPAGEVRKTFSKEASVKVSGNAAEVTAKDKMMTNTVEAILRCMVLGAKSGYKTNLKLIYAHFPITLEIKGKDISVKNFLGEKQARKARVMGTTKVEAKGQSVTISGPDKEDVGQTIANLRTAMRIKDKDPRVFQDGIYDAEGE